MAQLGAYRILINGIVQGVGFRPFIYNLALRDQLTGWVRNTSGGVEIEVCGPESSLERFLSSISAEAPPLSRIESIAHEPIPPDGYDGFQIQHSREVAGAFQPISPDVSICADCLEELFTPTDFRFRYAFINCTNCGPRFTIIHDIPYDRPKTTMAGFALCPACRAQYEDPRDRRFHAQPVACQDCGPSVWTEPSSREEILARSDQAIRSAQELLAAGEILAVKGLGGFHLACDAENPEAISKLRSRKDRPAKPLAVMMPDLAAVRKFCLVSPAEEELLSTPQRPILLLRRNPEHPLPVGIAPHQDRIGVMLPYTPLHYLLFSEGEHFPRAPYAVLVMTSANFRGNPILTGNQQVRDQLGGVADHYLFHDREIEIQCDDSVLGSAPLSQDGPRYFFPIRRSRGYAPQPLTSPLSSQSVLACGAELKNTFCHTQAGSAFISQHMGDLKNYPTLSGYEESIRHYEALFRIQPALLVHDIHPDYLSSRYALERSQKEGIPALPVQHHHAHIAACLADNQDPGFEAVIGFSFDGAGLGDDGAIWGGEVLVADYQFYDRVSHLAYFPLPGGDLAVREPWRCCLGLLHTLRIPWRSSLFPVAYAQSLPAVLPGSPVLDALQGQLEAGTNTPPTSSIGRLFDAAASLLGIRQTISYEGQAAIELEALADPNETGFYAFDRERDEVFSPLPLIAGILEDLANQTPIPIISARFHNSLAALVLEIALRIRDDRGFSRVALSGGVWQNTSLLTSAYRRLRAAGFEVLLHRNVPPNDGGLSLGQAVIGQKFLTLEE